MLFDRIMDFTGMGKVLDNFIVKPLFANLVKPFIEAVIGSLLSSGITAAFAEDPAYTAITTATADSIETLQGQFDFLTKPGGGFEQAESLMQKVQDDTMAQVYNQYSAKLEDQIAQGNNLIASTGFAGSGIAQQKANDMSNRVIGAYSDAAKTQSVKAFKESREFEIDKYNTLGQMEKEMNQLLGNYASTTGQTYSQGAGGISGLSTYQEGLLG